MQQDCPIKTSGRSMQEALTKTFEWFRSVAVPKR